MSNTMQRIIVGAIMALVVVAAAIGEYFGFPAVRYLGILVVLGMIVEMIICIGRTPRDVLKKNWISFGLFLLWLFVMLAAVNSVGSRPWIMLLLLLIICCADIGAWFLDVLLVGTRCGNVCLQGKHGLDKLLEFCAEQLRR